MNLLIIYPFYSQKRLMRIFSSKLGEHGISADVICVNDYDYNKVTNLRWPKLLQILFKSVNRLKEGLMKKVARKVIDRFFLGRIFSMYDIVDFHAYYPTYHHLMRVCMKKDIKFDITVWGSDLLRADDERKNILRFGFNHCYRIKLTHNLHEVMLSSYGNDYEDKSRIVYFGNSNFPIIDSLTDAETNEIKHRLYGNTEGKRIVVCGYNRIPAQNHIKMIEALSLLNDDEKRSIHVVLPMTYGSNSKYLSTIRNAIEQSGLSYTILDNYLDLDAIATVRKTADIVINVQTSDAIAGSLQDHLYCGNVCIFGEWLNYRIYQDNQIYYIKTKMEDITAHLKDVLLHFSEYHELCKNNHDKLKALLSWEATIANQVVVYDE